MNDARRMAEFDVMGDEAPARERMNVVMPMGESSIVPADSIAGRALIAVIGIMTFLAALTLGAVMLVRASAGEWQASVAREVTIQVRPTEGRDIEGEIKKAVDIAGAARGIGSVRPYTRDESERLLEPWLGSGLALEDLPVPRLIVVRIDGDSSPDLGALRKVLTERVAGASLDDHRGWIDRMRSMAGTAVGIGIGILVLMLAATMLTVTFATRGAMSTNRPIIEVLHFVGAKDGFIAGEFQRHFLLLGLKGGGIGGVTAMVLFAVAGFIGDWFTGTASQDQIAALFGSFAIGTSGYVAIAGLVVVIGGVTAATSRLTVYRTLRAMA
jgi:cell division transport system permease protein